MPNLGFPEILIILIVALLVFGPRKLPELGRSLGAGIREFKRGTSGLKEELEQSLRDEPVASAPAQTTPTQTVVAQAVVPPVTVAATPTETPEAVPAPRSETR